MSAPTRTADRYARALLQAALASGELDATRADLQRLAGAVASSPELSGFLPNYLLPRAARRCAMEALFAPLLGALACRFVMFVESRRRAGLLPAICAAFESLCERRQGVVRGRCTSAFAVPDALRERIAARLHERSGATLAMTYAEDRSLIGGFRIRIGDRIEDLTVAAQLKILKRKLAGASGVVG